VLLQVDRPGQLSEPISAAATIRCRRFNQTFFSCEPKIIRRRFGFFASTEAAPLRNSLLQASPAWRKAAVDVGAWLRELGLEQYEAAFRENAVDAEVLPMLTADDLKEMSIVPIGHRRRLLDAIAALRLPATPAEAPAQVSPSPPVDQSGPPSASESTAERRPLSVMFCDLIGSTALSARLDPEDLREVIRSYQARVAATIQQFNGFIARYVGDGVLIYFGWPEAHETDAARAVRAGLAVAAAVGETRTGGEPLQVRIGIATGLVVIGEPIGSGDSRQQTAIGETPNRVLPPSAWIASQSH
jgi:class 3 adenylate cyclase